MVTLVFLLAVVGLETLQVAKTSVAAVAVVVDIVVVARIVAAAAVEIFAAEGVVVVGAVAGGDFVSFVGGAVTYWRTPGSCPCSSVLATAAAFGGWAASVSWVR